MKSLCILQEWSNITTAFLFLLLLLPEFVVFPAALGLWKSKKFNTNSVHEEIMVAEELKKLFQKLIDELALALWEEPDCTETLRESLKYFDFADPLEFKSSEQLNLLFGVTTTKAKCINYDQRKGLVDLYNKLAPSSWTRKPGPKNWSGFFKRMQEKFVAPNPNCCKVQDGTRIEIGNKILGEALDKIVKEITSDDGKCLGIDILNILEDGNDRQIRHSDSYKIQIEINNLKKLDCDIEMKVKWLPIDVKLFNDKLPKEIWVKNSVIAIRDNHDLWEKVTKWNETNAMFKQLIGGMVQEIFESQEIPPKNKKQYFIKKIEQIGNKVETMHYFNLEAFFDYEHFGEFMKHVDKFEWEKIMTSTTEELKELLGGMANKWLPLELTANNKEQLDKMANDQFQREYEQMQREYAQIYRPLVGQLAQEYLNLVSTEKAEFCSQLGSFNFKNGKRGWISIFVHMSSMLDAMTSLVKDNWQNEETILKTTVENMADLKQFQGKFKSDWASTKSFLERIHTYYGGHQQIEIKLDAAGEKTLQAHCKECWQFLFTGIVYGFIKHCHAQSQSSRLDDMFNTDEKAGKMTTTMEMLKILQEEDDPCLEKMHYDLRYDAQFEQFNTASSYINIKNMEAFAKINGLPTLLKMKKKVNKNGLNQQERETPHEYGLSMRENVEKWVKFILRIDIFLNPHREQFILSKEQYDVLYENDLQKAYKTLGVEYGCSLVEAQKAYKDAALKYHPDKQQQRKEPITDEFERAKAAFDLIEKNIKDKKVAVNMPEENMERGK